MEQKMEPQNPVIKNKDIRFHQISIHRSYSQALMLIYFKIIVPYQQHDQGGLHDYQVVESFSRGLMGFRCSDILHNKLFYFTTLLQDSIDYIIVYILIKSCVDWVIY